MKYLITLLVFILMSCGAADITSPEPDPVNTQVSSVVQPWGSSITPLSSSSIYTPPPSSSSTAIIIPTKSQFTRYFSDKEYYYDVNYPVLECDASLISITANVGNTNTMQMSGSELCPDGLYYDNSTYIINLTVVNEFGVTNDGTTYKLYRGYETATQEYLFVQWFGEYGAVGDFRMWYESCYVGGLDLCDENGTHMMFHYRE